MPLHKLLFECPKEGYRGGEGSEGTVFEEQLRFLGVLSPEQGRLRAALMAAAAPHRERRAALSCAAW